MPKKHVCLIFSFLPHVVFFLILQILKVEEEGKEELKETAKKKNTKKPNKIKQSITAFVPVI